MKLMLTCAGHRHKHCPIEGESEQSWRGDGEGVLRVWNNFCAPLPLSATAAAAALLLACVGISCRNLPPPPPSLQCSTLWSCAARDSLQILLGQIPSHSWIPPPPLLRPCQAERAINWLIKRRVASFSLSLSLYLLTRLIAAQLTYNLDIAFDLPSPYGAREMAAHSLHTLHLPLAPLASCRVATRCLSLLLRSLLLLPLRVVFVALPIDQWQLQTVPQTPLPCPATLLLLSSHICRTVSKTRSATRVAYGTRHCRRGYCRVAPSYSPANYPLSSSLDLTNELQPLLSYV